MTENHYSQPYIRHLSRLVLFISDVSSHIRYYVHALETPLAAYRIFQNRYQAIKGNYIYT